MGSKFSNSKRNPAPVQASKPTTEADVLKAFPEFISSRLLSKDPREARKNLGVTEERLLTQLRQKDTSLTPERLKELLAKIQSGGSIEYGLFPTAMGSEKGWRKRW